MENWTNVGSGAQETIKHLRYVATRKAMSRFCNNNVRPRTNPGEKRWRWYEEAVSRRWQWNYERRGGMNVFLWKLFFFFPLSLFFPFFRTSNQRQITIVHSAAWGSFVNREKAGGGVRCMQHSSTETVKFPLLVLTRGALSRCKSIPVETRNLRDRIGECRKTTRILTGILRYVFGKIPIRNGLRYCLRESWNLN